MQGNQNELFCLTTSPDPSALDSSATILKISRGKSQCLKLQHALQWSNGSGITEPLLNQHVRTQDLQGEESVIFYW